MRYKPEHKRETRERILKAASRRFRQDGFAGTGFGLHVFDQLAVATGEKIGGCTEQSDLCAPTGASQPGLEAEGQLDAGSAAADDYGAQRVGRARCGDPLLDLTDEAPDRSGGHGVLTCAR